MPEMPKGMVPRRRRTRSGREFTVWVRNTGAPADPTNVVEHRGELTSLQLHLDYPADAVVRARRVRDVANGTYGACWAECRKHLLVAHGVAPLLKALGGFEPDRDFRPAWVRSRRRGPSGPGTADRRIKLLMPFEVRWPGGGVVDFAPTGRITDPDEIARLVAEHMTRFAQRIERQYPDTQHIICTGHLDSRLGLLVPKLRPERWHCYSQRPPGVEDVQRWLSEAGVEWRGRFFRGGRLRRDPDHFERVVDAIDGRSLPSQWVCGPVARIARELGGCVFAWSGRWGDGVNARSPSLGGGGYRNFWRRVRTHQQPPGAGQKRLMGCPSLSFYHSPEIWREVYEHYDPRACWPDLRPLIGRKLLGRDVPPVRNRGFPAGPCPNRASRRDLFRGYLLRLARETGADESIIHEAWPWTWEDSSDDTQAVGMADAKPAGRPGTTRRAAVARRARAAGRGYRKRRYRPGGPADHRAAQVKRRHAAAAHEPTGQASQASLHAAGLGEGP